MTSPLTPWKPWRIVLDTSVLIAALRSTQGAAAVILNLIFNREIRVCMDLKLACEYQAVATRPDQLAASKRTLPEVEQLITRIEDAAEFVDVRSTYDSLSTDSEDDMVLHLAIFGEVDAIVTHNVRHMLVPASRFGIAVLSPAGFLAALAEER